MVGGGLSNHLSFVLCSSSIYVCSDVLCACRTKFIAGTECSKIRQKCNFGSNFQIGRK